MKRNIKRQLSQWIWTVCWAVSMPIIRDKNRQEMPLRTGTRSLKFKNNASINSQYYRRILYLRLIHVGERLSVDHRDEKTIAQLSRDRERETKMKLRMHEFDRTINSEENEDVCIWTGAACVLPFNNGTRWSKETTSGWKWTRISFSSIDTGNAVGAATVGIIGQSWSILWCRFNRLVLALVTLLSALSDLLNEARIQMTISTSLSRERRPTARWHVRR